MAMWQQLLDRFIPLMDGDASALDQRDGVGASYAPVTAHARTADVSPSAGRLRASFEGSASPLPS